MERARAPTVRIGVGALASAGALLAIVACGSKLPRPPYTAQPTSALAEIPYPPPPARAESVPPKPREGAVWIDGEWVWRARRWSWRPGRWVTAPPGARFAPWVTVRDRTGALYLASGAWRAEDGGPVAEPPALASAVPGAGAIVSPQGSTVEQGPLAPVDAGAGAPGSGDELAPGAGRASMPGAEEP